LTDISKDIAFIIPQFFLFLFFKILIFIGKCPRKDQRFSAFSQVIFFLEEISIRYFSKGAECFELLIVQQVLNDVMLLIGTIHSFVKLGTE